MSIYLRENENHSKLIIYTKYHINVHAPQLQ